MFFVSDWTRHYKDAAAITKDIPAIIIPQDKFEGWIESKTDTVYIKYYNDDTYVLYCWNRPYIRDELLWLLSQPVHKVKE